MMERVDCIAHDCFEQGPLSSASHNSSNIGDWGV